MPFAPTRLAHIALTLLLAGLLAGCVFDDRGLPGTDGTVPDMLKPDKKPAPDMARDLRPDVAADLTPDITPDVGPDMAVDPECVKGKALSCRKQSGDTAGQTGQCTGGKFTLIRNCYSVGKCSDTFGICSMGCGTNCVHGGCGTGSACVPFIQSGASELQSCCAGTSKNGPNKAMNSCTAHTECVNGACSDKGVCVMPCKPTPFDTCQSQGLECVHHKVTLGKNTYTVMGCAQPAAKPDAGPPDMKVTPDLPAVPDMPKLPDLPKTPDLSSVPTG